jgi:hypothetical protein
MADVPEVDKVLLMREISGGAKGWASFLRSPTAAN